MQMISIAVRVWIHEGTIRRCLGRIQTSTIATRVGASAPLGKQEECNG